MKYLKTLISAIGAGMLIALGGLVFIAFFEINKFIGALLFSLGLFTIIISKMHLYTGKIGFLFDNKPNYLIELLLTWIGNFIGAGIIAIGYRLTRNSIIYNDILDNIVNTKINDNWYSILILSIFCGMMIFIAVNAQKKDIHPVFKLFAIVMPVIVFIIAGFEHVVANMFYFLTANEISGKMVLYLLIMTLGNSIGSWFLWGIEKIIFSKENKTIQHQ